MGALKRYHALDAWRGICALLVAFYHLQGYWHHFTDPITENAGAFVDFFFVLSGFVIAHAYANKLGTTTSSTTFVLRRLGRVWPLHLAVLFAFVGLQCVEIGARGLGLKGDTLPFTGRYSIDAFIANIFLIHSMGIYAKTTWNAVSWSISTEFYAYVAFCLFCVTFGFRRRIAPWLIAAIVVASLAILVAFAPEGMKSKTDFGYWRCLAGFFCGVLVWQIKDKFHPSGWMEFVCVPISLLFVAAPFGEWMTYGRPFAFAMVVLIFAAEKGAISKLLITPPLQAIGRWSYSIYMIHFFLLETSAIGLRVISKILGVQLLTPEKSGAWHMHWPPLALAAWTLGFLTVLLLLSSFSYKLIEIPGQKLFRRLEDRVTRSSIQRSTAGENV